MLSKRIIQRARDVIEKGYTARCSVFEMREIQRKDFSTTHAEMEIHKDIPCRLSFQTISSTQNNSMNAKKEQVVKLFLAPEVELKAGSKVRVSQNGVISDYACSSQREVHETHQEVVVRLLERWA